MQQARVRVLAENATLLWTSDDAHLICLSIFLDEEIVLKDLNLTVSLQILLFNQ